MYSCAPFFKAYSYQPFIQFTVYHLIHLIQNVQLCIFVHNGATLCYFLENLRSVVQKNQFRFFLMLYLSIMSRTTENTLKNSTSNYEHAVFISNITCRYYGDVTKIKWVRAYSAWTLWNDFVGRR